MIFKKAGLGGESGLQCAGAARPLELSRGCRGFFITLILHRHANYIYISTRYIVHSCTHVCLHYRPPAYVCCTDINLQWLIADC